MPDGEELGSLAAHGATLVIHLGAQAIEEIAHTLAPHYGPDCPVAVVARASWPDELVLRGTLATIAAAVERAGIRRTATILVGQALAAAGFRDSHLYSPQRQRVSASAGAGRSP
jgi:precorrin-4/cobalt-precorrin-4 C11-methyltransferase